MDKDEARFIDALYLGATDQAGFQQAITALATLFDAPSASLVDLDAAAPETSVILGVGVFGPEVQRLYNEQFAPLDPAPAAFASLPAGLGSTTNRLIPEERRRTCVFLNEFYRPIGLEECLGGTLSSENGRFSLVGIHRGPRREAFSDQDIARLERLMPHVARGLQIRRAFLGLERKTGALAATADRAPAGMVGLDHEGRSLFANRAAVAIAAQCDGLSLDRRGWPQPSDREAARRLIALQNDVTRGGPGGLVHVPRPSGKRAYVVLVCRLPPGGGTAGHGLRRCGTLFLIHDPARIDIPAAEALASILGLPIGTAKVVAALVAGEDLKEFAARTGITTNTVYFHIKVAFARTGVHRQTDLVRIALSALADLRRP